MSVHSTRPGWSASDSFAFGFLGMEGGSLVAFEGIFLTVAVLFALYGLAYGAYGLYMHPAWRRQRRIQRACAEAFREMPYTLVRFRIRGHAPSGKDLLPNLASYLASLLQVSVKDAGGRYFTYSIESESEPDISRLSRKQRRLLRRYMYRNSVPLHHGKEVIANVRPETSTEHSGEKARP